VRTALFAAERLYDAGLPESARGQPRSLGLGRAARPRAVGSPWTACPSRREGRGPRGTACPVYKRHAFGSTHRVPKSSSSPTHGRACFVSRSPTMSWRGLRGAVFVVGGRRRWPRWAGGSAREGARRGWQGQRIGISDVELRVLHEHSVGQQVTELGLGPSVHDAVNHAVQIGARVDVVRDAGGDDG
jgi:hypothetical protein